MPVINPLNAGPNGFLGEELGSISSLLTRPSKYEFVKRFVNVPRDVRGGSNGVTSLDDPTYLGFSLLFVANSPLFNGAEGGSSEAPVEVINTSPEDNAATLQGASSEYAGESAVGYLEQIGETKRAQYLRAFIQGIQEINRTRPYYFQSIDGLSAAWTASSDVSSDPYTGSKEGEGITIGCLEAIDLKLSALFSLYKLAVFDTKYRRYVLPANLLKFDVNIYVQEIRQFQTTKKGLINFLVDKYGNGDVQTKDFVNSNTSQIGFKFKECQWDATASGKVFDTVSNSEMAVAATDIKFSYSSVWFDSQFSGYNSSLDEGKDQTVNSSLSAGIDPKEILANQALNQATKLAEAAKQKAKSLAQSLLLGNVFGLGNRALSAITNPQALTNALNGAVLNRREEEDPNIPQRVGDRILPEGQLPTNNDGVAPRTINSQRLFSPVPPGPPLDSTNIFG